MKKGDCCDIVEILSTEERDFLVRNNGDKVKIENLRGKTICIFFLSLHKNWEYGDPCMLLEEVYKELYPKGEFEVVFVAETEEGAGSQKIKKPKIEVEELFNNIFSKMPWLSVPFTDVETRNRLCNLLNLPTVWGPDCAILDPKGKVLLTHGNCILEDYGAESYPFTDERIKEIKEEDQAVWAKLGLRTLFGFPSGKGAEEEDKAVRENLFLKTLLVSSTCDFVITNKFEKLPISELEGKVVGLFMYDGQFKEIMQKLLKAYMELQKREEKFEIVLVNLHFNGGYSDQDSFDQNFEGMPWLALPFMDKRIRKLWRIFGKPGIDDCDDEGILVIVEPGGKFVETDSSSILKYYGAYAYPFTKQKVVEIEKIRYKKVTLDSLLAKADKDYVIKRDGTKIPFSNLKGKSILLFFLYPDRKNCGGVVSKLIEWYEEIKGKDEKFEVILVSKDESKSSFDNFFSEMPWLAFPHDVLVWNVFSQISDIDSPELVAFGTDGHFVTREAFQRLQNHGADAYPFTDHLDEEIYQERETLHWKFWGEDKNQYQA